MAPLGVRRYPIRLLVRRLPHDTTADSVIRAISESYPSDNVGKVMSVYMIAGCPKRDGRPSVPSTAVVTIQPTAQHSADGNIAVCDRAFQMVAEVFDGKIVFGSGDADDPRESTVEVSSVCLRVPSCMRSGRGSSEARISKLRKIAAGSIEDDEDYKRFCAAAGGRVSESGDRAAGREETEGPEDMAEGESPRGQHANGDAMLQGNRKQEVGGGTKGVSTLVQHLISDAHRPKEVAERHPTTKGKPISEPDVKVLKVLVHNEREDEDEGEKTLKTVSVKKREWERACKPKGGSNRDGSCMKTSDKRQRRAKKQVDAGRSAKARRGHDDTAETPGKREEADKPIIPQWTMAVGPSPSEAMIKAMQLVGASRNQKEWGHRHKDQLDQPPPKIKEFKGGQQVVRLLKRSDGAEEEKDKQCEVNK